MKRFLFTLVVAALAGCSSTPPAQEKTSNATQDQVLISTFARNSIKLEWSCKYLTGFSNATCIKGNVVAIEATGYAPAYGNTEALRETAFSVAHDVAVDKIVRFIKQDLTSSRVTHTLTKNVEKANDLIKHNAKTTAEQSEEAANADSSETDRSNVNETVRTVVENIRTQASGIVRGAQIIDEKVVDQKTVAVTVRWSIQNSEQSSNLQNYFK